MFKCTYVYIDMYEADREVSYIKNQTHFLETIYSGNSLLSENIHMLCMFKTLTIFEVLVTNSYTSPSECK